MAKLKNLKTSKSMNLNMIAKIGYGRLCSLGSLIFLLSKTLNYLTFYYDVHDNDFFRRAFLLLTSSGQSAAL
jgi:predicted Abi (CAAX) family protease